MANPWDNDPVVDEGVYPEASKKASDAMDSLNKKGAGFDITVDANGNINGGKITPKKEANPWESDPVVEKPKAAPAKPATPPKPERPARDLGDIIPTQAAIGETAMTVASGALAAPISGWAGIIASAAKTLGVSETEAADMVRMVQDKLTYKPQTKIGKEAVDAAMYLPEMYAKGAGYVGGKATDLTAEAGASLGLAPETTAKVAADVGTSVDTVLQMLPGLLLTKGKKTTPQIDISALDKPTIDMMKLANENGIKLAPSSVQEVKPNAFGTNAEGLVTSPKLKKILSLKNAPKVDEIAKTDLGIDKGVPISNSLLGELESKAGTKYQAVKDMGKLNLDADGSYTSALENITKSRDTAAAEYSHRTDSPFQKTLDSLKSKPIVDAASAIEEVKLLRKDANKIANADDAWAYRKMANAIDDGLSKALEQKAATANDPKIATAVAEYKAARTQIAKINEYREALNDTTGHIDAHKMAQLWDNGNGKPLSGGSLVIAKLATRFPDVFTPTQKIGPVGLDALDLIRGGQGENRLGAISNMVQRSALRYGLAGDIAQSKITAPPTTNPGVVRSLPANAYNTAINPVTSNPGVQAFASDKERRKQEILSMMRNQK